MSGLPFGVLPVSLGPGDTAVDVAGWVWTAVVRERGSRQRRRVCEGGDGRARSGAWLIGRGLFTHRG